MNRQTPLKRTPMKRGKPKRRPSMAAFWAAVTANGTAPCALADGSCDFWPTGRPDAHHHVKAQRLTDEQKVDPRNGVSLCRRHHSEVHACRVVCPRPAEFDAFLADFDLHERVAP